MHRKKANFAMEYSLEIVLLAFVFGFLLGALFGYGLALISVSNRAQTERKESQHSPAPSAHSELNIQMSSTDVRDLSDSSPVNERTMRLPMIGKLEPSSQRFARQEQTTLHVSRDKISHTASLSSEAAEQTQELSLTDHPLPASPSMLKRTTEAISDADEATRLYEKPRAHNP